jgi:hypothetical protein
MLVAMNRKARGLSARIAVLSLLSIAVMLGQNQEREKQKAATDKSDFTPVTLSMKWARGDTNYGSNFIRLSTPCQASDDVRCECTMEFKAIKSPEFADSISSFGDALVSVVYQVSYGPDGFAHRTRLESVGSWQAERFQVKDRLLGIHFAFKGGKPGQRQKVNFHAPEDCLPPLRK